MIIIVNKVMMSWIVKTVLPDVMDEWSERSLASFKKLMELSLCKVNNLISNSMISDSLVKSLFVSLQSDSDFENMFYVMLKYI